MHRERESSDAAASEGYQNSEADKHVVYSTVAERKGCLLMFLALLII